MSFPDYTSSSEYNYGYTDPLTYPPEAGSSSLSRPWRVNLVQDPDFPSKYNVTVDEGFVYDTLFDIEKVSWVDGDDMVFPYQLNDVGHNTTVLLVNIVAVGKVDIEKGLVGEEPFEPTSGNPITKTFLPLAVIKNNPALADNPDAVPYVVEQRADWHFARQSICYNGRVVPTFARLI